MTCGSGQLPDEVDPFATSDRDVHQISDVQPHRIGEAHRSIHLGALVRGPSRRSLRVDVFDEHLSVLPDPLLGTLGHELIDEVGQPASTFLDDLVRHMPVESGCLGVLLIGVGEDPGDVQSGLGKEVVQDGDVLVGLTGETGDEVGSKPRLGAALSNVVDDPQERLGVTEPTHPPQQGAGGVLEGQVEVRDDLWGCLL